MSKHPASRAESPPTVDPQALPSEWRALVDFVRRSPWMMALLAGPDHVFVLANDAYRAVVGQRDLTGRPAREVFPELADQGIFALMDRVYATGEPVLVRAMPISFDRLGNGQLDHAYFEFSYQPIFGDNDAISGIVSLAIEVTDQQRALADLAAANERNTALIESISEGFVLLDNEWRYTLVNSQTERALNVPRGSMLGRTIWELFPQLVGSPFEHHLRESQRLQARSQFDVASAVAPSWLRVSTFPSAEGLAFFITDITDIKRSEIEREQLLAREQAARAEAEAAARAREQFLAIAAHELRAPLTAIKGFSQILERKLARDGSVNPEVAALLSKIEQAIGRQTGMISDLLDLARLHTGQLPINRASRDLCGLVSEITGRYREAIASGRHPIRLDIASGPLLAEVDDERFTQVLVNLLDNAVKYSPEGGPIRVRLEPSAGGAVITVHDQGIGLAPGTEESIFTPFEQGSNARKNGIAGLGVGLHVCRLVIEQHGGWIRAESPGESLGTTMHIWLPLAAPPRTTSQSSA